MAEQLPQHFAAAFVATHDEAEVARQLRSDLTLIDEGRPCSWVALYTPASKTEDALKIARCLSPSPNLNDNIKRMLYESMTSRVRQHLNCNGIFATQREIEASQQRLKDGQRQPLGVSPEKISITLDVLTNLMEITSLDPDLPLRKVIESLRQMTAAEDESTESQRSADMNTTAESDSAIPKPPTLPRKRLCYICRLSLTVPHPTQPAMCTPCGAFNLASSQISTPPTLTLSPTFTALVTGARINLGYHTTLRLLRCGARVIATTRYPRDAVMRYAQESDFSVWRERLKIIGADFRCAANVFALVKDTRNCLRTWGGTEKLHLLVNNAAQTLTDSVRKEEMAIQREAGLLRPSEQYGLCISDNYAPRVRGGGLLMALSGVDNERGLTGTSDADSCLHSRTASQTMIRTHHAGRDVEVYSKSSWVQNLFEIPYEDLISAHSVNTFVPLILCRELLPLMGKEQNVSELVENRSGRTKPEAYIINVSSREGIFENQTRSIGKAGKHVHTNMSKAALNMITETEAASAWHSRRIAMNTVDPGYMSAAPEYEASFDGHRPIGWEDGAGRVLWPLAVGELENHAVWGRFLKHYGAVHVEPGAGRG